ncbi:hypothetical protein ACJX0J_006047, partial [Zea mays]
TRLEITMWVLYFDKMIQHGLNTRKYHLGSGSLLVNVICCCKNIGNGENTSFWRIVGDTASIVIWALNTKGFSSKFESIIIIFDNAIFYICIIIYLLVATAIHFVNIVDFVWIL